MITVEHPHFGRVRISAKTTALATTLAGQPVRVDLTVANPDGDPSSIEAVLDRAADLASLDRAARAAIDANAAEEGGAALMYHEHHLPELDPDELGALFGTTDPAKVSVSLFLGKMRLIRAGLYPSSAGAQVILDYSLDPERTQYVLCVSFDGNGQPTGVDMES